MTVGKHELPRLTKFLLIAAFLASFNPTKDDMRFFSRDSGPKRTRKRAGHKSNKGIAKVISTAIVDVDISTTDWPEIL